MSLFSTKFDVNKLRANLRVTISRLKLLEKKKTEITLKSRKEIADYISAGKEDRARIRVEQIVREDYLVEAMELIEMLCDLLVARMGLIQNTSVVDPGLEEPIATILWSTPRLVSDVPELQVVCKQLTLKYGKLFAESCCNNSLGNVSEKVMHKLSFHAPPKQLIERYMVEIARSFNVPFDPDPNLMDDGKPQYEDDLGPPPPGIFPGGGGHNRGGGGDLIGWDVPPPDPMGGSTIPPGHGSVPYQPGSNIPWHEGSQHGSDASGGPGGDSTTYWPNKPGIHNPNASQEYPGEGSNNDLHFDMYPPPATDTYPPPYYPRTPEPSGLPPGASSQGPPLPERPPQGPLPPIGGSMPPSQSNSCSTSEDRNLDFDDLTKRFELLKQRK